MFGDMQKDLRAAATTERAVHSGYFFKAGPGQYAEGDAFIGNTVPGVRIIAKKYRDATLGNLHSLLASKWHEERLLALIILVGQYQKFPARRQEIFQFYLCHSGSVASSFVPKIVARQWAAIGGFYGINNWDLVDTSAGYIVGQYLDGRPEQLVVLEALAMSANLWERRIAIIATFAYIKQGRPAEGLQIATILLGDTHDLIHKAVGWMLREIGKRCGRDILQKYLVEHYKTMPRTTLRYAIEHFDANMRKAYLNGTI